MATHMMCMGHYAIKPPIYEKFTMKNKCIRTNGKLENGFLYLYQVIHFDVMNVFITYTKHKP